MKRRFAHGGLAFLALVLITALVAGCTKGSVAPPAPPKPVVTVEKGGKLVIASPGGVDSLDPAATVSGAAGTIFGMINDTLVYKTDKGFGGNVAERWEPSADGKVWTFHIRKDVVFSNGNPVNADAVVFTFNRILDPNTKSPARSFIATLQKVDKVDEFTVAFTLVAPSALLLDTLSIVFFGILDPKAVAQYGADYGRNPVGSGPFKFKEWVTGDRIVLVPNEKHKSFLPNVKTKGAPLLDELIIREIPSVDTQLAAIRSGEANMIGGLPGDKAAQFKDRPGFKLDIARGGTNLSYLSFGMDKAADGGPSKYRAPFDDIRLRQAVGYAIDAPSIIDKVLYGSAIRDNTPMPTGNFGYDANLSKLGPDYNVAKAKELLDAAGWKPGADGIREKDGKKLEIKFWVIPTVGMGEAAQVIQNQLGQVGMKVNLTQYDAATYTAKAVTGDFQVELLIVAWPGPNFLSIIATLGWGFGASNDKELLGMLAQAEATTDDAQRFAAYGNAQKRILENAAIVPLWTMTPIVLSRDSVKNFVFDPIGGLVLNDVYIKE